MVDPLINDDIKQPTGRKVRQQIRDPDNQRRKYTIIDSTAGTLELLSK
jgi:hypothetical protein